MKYNVAIIGAGIGAEHLAAYRKLPLKFNVRRIIDQDVTRANTLCHGSDIEVSEDIDDALNDLEVDIIDICLPPHLHAKTLVQSLEAGKHAICEKPLATNLTDIDAIEHAAEKTLKKVFPVFQYRWGPALAQMRHLIQLGLAGRPQVASLETHWSRGSDYYAVPWRGTWQGEQGGAVLGHAIHNHDLMTHIMGPVRSVCAFTTTRVNDIETEDCAALSFEMENGALATSSITLGSADNQTRLRFVFEHLTATSGTTPYAPAMDDWHFVARDPVQQANIDAALSNAPAEPSGYEGFFAAVHNSLSDNGATAVTLQEGAASIALVTAIYDAARTGRRVELPISSSHVLYKGWTP